MDDEPQPPEPPLLRPPLAPSAPPSTPPPAPPSGTPGGGPPPVATLSLEDDLQRSRLTVLLRLLMAIPHLILLGFWTIGAVVAAIITWFAALFTGIAPTGLHKFLVSYIRYATRVTAFTYLVANPFTPFSNDDPYPVDVVMDPPARQRRWTVLLRIVLVIPSALLVTVVGASSIPSSANYNTAIGVATSGGGFVVVAAILAWFYALATRRAPRGLRDLAAYGLWYTAQFYAYTFVLTDRYPTCDPTRAWPFRLPHHPVRVVFADEARRSRLTVLFRLALAAPHLVWLALWSAVVLPAAIVNWLVTLIRGRSAGPLHRFLAAYVRYTAHFGAFLQLVGNPFPGFTGKAGSYPVDVEIDPPAPQNRSTTLFRGILVLPALLVSSAFGTALFTIAVLGWCASLLTGRMPDGLRRLGAVSVRYQAQTSCYLLLLTDRYPDAGPALYDSPPSPPDELDLAAQPA